MEEEKRILIVCGEASGDLNAANLVEKILEINPAIKISGVGGKLLHSAGAEIFCDIKDFAVIGIFDVLKKLPKFFALKKLILEKIKEITPAAIILVDFSGFNLRLAKELNGIKAPIIYYISPQVWASRQGRIKTIKKYISKMIVLFKFEEEFYKRYGVDADFVGHPLLDITKPAMTSKEFLAKSGLSGDKTTIALLPGSRKTEIKYILPVMLKASRIIAQKIKNVQFVIAKTSNIELEFYTRCIKNFNFDLKIIENKTYDCLNIADFCMVASGTATLETAIMQKPFLAVYKMNLLNYLLYRPQIKVPYICIVNIIAGKKIVPEFIQFQATPQKIAEKTLEILHNTSGLKQMKNLLSQIKTSLGPANASLQAAKIIVNIISRPG